MGSKPIGISASRGAAILGLNEWQSQFEIWQIIMEEREPGFNARMGFKLPDPPDNAAIRWGTAFEEGVISEAEIVADDTIIDRERLYEKNGITCHIDGRYSIGGELHEGKTTSSMAFRAKWGIPGTSHIPKNYQIQVQHQMALTDAPSCIVSVLVFPDAPETYEQNGCQVLKSHETNRYFVVNETNGFNDDCIDMAAMFSAMGYFYQYPVEANRDTQKLIFEAYEDFWNTYILTGKEPVIDRYDDIKRAFPDPVGTIVCDETLERWLSEYASIREEIGKSGPLAKKQDQLKTMVLDAARKMDPVIDDDSRNKTVFLTQSGKKLGSYSRDKRGYYIFR